MIVPWVLQWSGESARTWIAVCPYVRQPAVFRITEMGHGQPLWKEMHPNRLRQAIARTLCQVCSGYIEDKRLSLSVMEADRVIEPLVCAPCALLSLEHCPELRAQAEEGLLRIREVRSYRWIPLPNAQGVVEDIDIELLDYSERGIEWIKTHAFG